MILRSSISHLYLTSVAPKTSETPIYFSTARNHQHIPAKGKNGSIHPGRCIVFQSMMNAFTYYEQIACHLKHYGYKNPSLWSWMVPFHGHDVKLLGIAKFNTFACFWAIQCDAQELPQKIQQILPVARILTSPPQQKNKLQNLPSLQLTARP